MRHERHYDYEKTGGTFLQGYVDATYHQLEVLFGRPLRLDGSKVQAEWVVEFFDKDKKSYIATIYDWKQDIVPEGVTRWNVGGFVPEVVGFVAHEVSMADYLEEKYIRTVEPYR